MPMRKVVLLVVALLIGIVTVLIARSMLSAPATTAAVEAKAPVTFEILVASRDIPSGTMLKETDVVWKVWPKEEGATSYAVKGQNEIKDYVGTVARHGLRNGEPLTTTRVVKPGEQGFMAAALAPGMRAVSISITPVAGVAGFVFPGDRVDVIVTHQIGRKTDMDPAGRRVSETVLQNVRVLALDQKMNDQIIEPKVAQIATLEVSAKQAETVALVSQIGTLSLALRSIANDPEDKPQEAALNPDGSIALDAAAMGITRPASDSAHPITWDSDVSQVLPRPANRRGAVQKIQIIRGKESTESIYELQP